jgi:tripartite ATP-independent transporter DctM subunit
MELQAILLLICSFFLLLAIGVPIAYSVAISAVLTMLVHMPWDIALITMSQRMATGLDSFALIAIPFFILAGNIMNTGGIAKRLIDFAKVLVGMFPGGLAFVNIIACMLFGAISGSAVAAASAIGGFMHPILKKEGYDESYAAAINISSATTGMVIPPSNILIVYSLASGGVSIGALFMAGYIPGILMGLSLMVVGGIFAVRRGYPSSPRPKLMEAVKSFLNALPSLFLLVVVIGGIIAGIFTATEASAIAVVYTLILGFLYKELSLKKLREVILKSVNTTSIVAILIAASMAMSWMLSYENIPSAVSEILLGVSNNPIVILLIINATLLLVGVFMDMTPAVLVFTPIFLPVAVEIGIDPIHFGIMMVMNLCIGLCTPPVGSVLFVGCGVANIGIQRVIRPLIPLFAVLVLVLLLVAFIPELSLWLPRLVGY